MHKKLNGFTLIELIIALTIISIIITLAAPNISQFMSQNQALQQSHSFISALQLGLSSAENSTNPVTLCAKNASNNTCVTYTNAPTADIWRNGWILFNDNDNDGIYNAGNDSLIQIQSNPTNTINITAPSSAITITPNGNITKGVGNYDFKPQPCTANNAHRITLNKNGQITAQATTCP